MAALNFDIKTFVEYIIVLKIEMKILINLLDKITILIKYLNYTNDFLLEFAVKFLGHNNYNYIIKFEKSKQL